MNALSLNLLRYPRSPWRATWSWARWVLAGLCVGVTMATAWGVWSQGQMAVWQQQRQDLQSRLGEQSKSVAQAAAQAELSRKRQQALAQHMDWQARRGQWLRLHEVLVQAAAVQGLRVQRWQGDEHRLQLQGRLTGLSAWPQLQAQLSAAGPQDWRLNSLASDPVSGIELALESSWAAAPKASREGRP